MSIESFESDLNNIVLANDKVVEFERCSMDLSENIKYWEGMKDYIIECEELNTELTNERKAHAEELRQINQDINHLEDILKNLRSQRDSKRATMLKKIEEFRTVIENANEAIRETGLGGDLLLDENEELSSKYFDCMLSSPLLTPLLSLGSLPLGFPFNLQGLQFPSAKSPLDTCKMKNCDACGASIHRNAPTCPMCKTRSVSKNPKRRRIALEKAAACS